ncbi:MAG: hypothetical protein GX091_02310, partial [Peptococcaceae bacterium]|nr:hypothetical protein [Peptococcaceae bacterium]
AIKRYLDEFPGDIICALQVWYEGLGGCGVPTPADMEAMNAVLNTLEDWEPIGDVRYEKFGAQKSFKRVKALDKNKFMGGGEGQPNKLMVQHLFKLGRLYKAPDGRIFKVVVSDVFNIRLFEIKDGKMVGRMLKYHPTSEFAQSLVEIAD